MKKGFKLIVPSFLAIIVCVLLVTASTYALFTSDATVNLSVGSATVKVSAEVTNMKTYSITHENTGNFDEAGTIQDGDFAATYYYALQEEGKFAVGGTASFANGTLTLDKMVPGDKVTFTLDSANQSNVDVKYRLSIEATENSSEALLSALQFKIGSEDPISGLKNYYTEWFNSADTALTDTNFEIVFPLTAGNYFQDKTVGYEIKLEAVQANAKTSGEKNYEAIDLYVEEAKSEAQTIVEQQDTNVQVSVTNVPIDNTNLSVNASIPADNTYKDADDQPMTVSSTSLKVSDLFVQTNSLTNETSIAADVKLLDQTGNEIKSVDPEKPVTVTVYVGKGFNSVRVKHNGNPIDSTYDSDEGTVTFTTSSFSPFEFIGDFGALIGTTYYSTFDKAYKAAQNGDTIVLLKDIESSRITISGNDFTSLTIDGGQNQFGFIAKGENIDNGRLINVFDGNIEVTFKNTKIIGPTAGSYTRGLNIADPNTIVNLDNCTITCNNYAINICLDTTIIMDIKNSSITGWSALNIWSDGVTINAEKSTFVGINDKSVSSWNTFSTVCLEADSTGMTPINSSNMNVVFDDCTLIARTLNSNKQSVVGFNNSASVGATNNIVTIKNSKIILDGETASLYYDYGTQNKLIVQNSKLNDEVFEISTPSLFKSEYYDTDEELYSAIDELDEQYAVVGAYVTTSNKYYFKYCLASELSE